MQYARPLFVSALLAVAACSCDETQTTRARGILTIDPKAADFGTGCVGDTVERQVVLTNIGNGELEILDVAHAGGDAFVLFEDPPQFLESGESFVLRIGLTPTEARDYAGTVSVTTDDEENPTQSVTLIGKGFDGETFDLQVSCEYTPGSGRFDKQSCLSLDFDNVLVGTVEERQFRVENHGCGVVRVNELLVYADPNGDASPEELAQFSITGVEAPFEVFGQSERIVTVRYAPTEVSEPAVRLSLRSSDPATKNPLWSPGEWDLGVFANAVAPALLVDPNTLTFFDAVAGTPLTKNIHVRNTGGSPLTIDSLTVTGPESNKFSVPTASFTLAPTGDADDERVVAVTYLTQGSDDRATLTIKAGAEESVVMLLGGAQPILSTRWIDPSTGNERIGTVDFGVTETGAKGVERTVRLYNEGRAPLALREVRITANPGGGFKLPSPPTGTIAVDTFVEAKIIFDDKVTLRNDAARLEVVSNDPVDAMSGGVRRIDLSSTNEPNFAPIPNIVVCPKVSDTSTNCSSGVSVGNVVELDASQSTGPETSDSLTFHWRIIRAPSGSSVRVEAPNQPKTRIVSDDGAKIDAAGNYVVGVLVTDQFENTAEGTQAITVR